MAAAIHRAAAPLIAHDLPRSLRPRASGLRIRSFPNGGASLIVGLAPRGWRSRAPLLALIIVVEEGALRANDPAAVAAFGLVAMLADQRADARGLQLDGIERVDAGNLGVEFCAGVAVEHRQRPLRRRVPVAVGRAGKTPDPMQFGLNRFGDLGRAGLGRIRSRAQRGQICPGGLVRRRLLGRRTISLGLDDLLLRGLLGLLGSQAGLFRGFRIGLGIP